MTCWQFLETGPGTGLHNMRVDEALAATFPREGFDGTVRLYSWFPWAVSIGRHQRMEDIDTDRCADASIDVVRRPTGGRAILHAQELTYSVVMSARRGVSEVYNDVSLALLRGLKEFGIEASFQRSQPDFRSEYRTPSSLPCFSSSARYEIEIGGRKLVGSAQRRYSHEGTEVVLQHGSILCGPAHLRLADFLKCEDPVRERIRGELERKTICLEEVLGYPVGLPDLAECIRRGFEISWGIRLPRVAIPLSDGGVHA